MKQTVTSMSANLLQQQVTNQGYAETAALDSANEEEREAKVQALNEHEQAEAEKQKRREENQQSQAPVVLNEKKLYATESKSNNDTICDTLSTSLCAGSDDSVQQCKKLCSMVINSSLMR